MSELLRYLPTNCLSRLVGFAAAIPLPRFFTEKLIAWYVRRYGVDLTEVDWPADGYRSLAEFFVRTLRTGTRPIGTGFVSPVDGELRSAGVIQGQKIEAIKGRDYALADLLGAKELADRFQGGSFFNLYLSPKDYHHIHSPLNGAISQCTYIPGRLWPVNEWGLKNIPNLFAVNERVVVLLETELGLVAVVLVGACNVGKISLSFDPLITNRCGRRNLETKTFNSKIPIAAGAPLGTFHLGSTVVLLLEPGKFQLNKSPRLGPIKMGQEIKR